MTRKNNYSKMFREHENPLNLNYFTVMQRMKLGLSFETAMTTKKEDLKKFYNKEYVKSLKSKKKVKLEKYSKEYVMKLPIDESFIEERNYFLSNKNPFKINYYFYINRIRDGWEMEDALFTPYSKDIFPKGDLILFKGEYKNIKDLKPLCKIKHINRLYRSGVSGEKLFCQA